MCRPPRVKPSEVNTCCQIKETTLNNCGGGNLFPSFYEQTNNNFCSSHFSLFPHSSSSIYYGKLYMIWLYMLRTRDILQQRESFHSILQTTVITVCKTSFNIQKLCIESKQQMYVCVFYIIPAINITNWLVLVTDTLCFLWGRNSIYKHIVYRRTVDSRELLLLCI